MRPLWPASSRVLVASAVIALGNVTPARAEDPRPFLLFKAPLPRAAARWRERLARRLGPLGSGELELSVAASAPSLAGERLLFLRRIELLLASAHEQAAALAEDQALANLAEAVRLGEQLGDVPGAAAWNAEIELELGVTAAQAGLNELAEGAFRTAATLDRSRRLLEAEAAPAVVQLYERVEREVAVAPRGQLEVRVTAVGAHVYLDDVAQGTAPVRIHTSVGRHVLRVEAPGHRVYGALIDVLEGQRPALTVQPSPVPALEQARMLISAAKLGDYPSAARAFRELKRAAVGLGPMLVLEVANEKALLVHCDAAGCRAPLRLPDAELPQFELLASGAPLDARSLIRDRAWLLQPAKVTDALAPPIPWWRRWYVWGSVLVAATAGTALALALSADRRPMQRLRVVIEPGDVGQ